MKSSGFKSGRIIRISWKVQKIRIPRGCQRLADSESPSAGVRNLVQEAPRGFWCPTRWELPIPSTWGLQVCHLPLVKLWRSLCCLLVIKNEYVQPEEQQEDFPFLRRALSLTSPVTCPVPLSISCHLTKMYILFQAPLIRSLFQYEIQDDNDDPYSHLGGIHYALDTYQL